MISERYSVYFRQYLPKFARQNYQIFYLRKTLIKSGSHKSQLQSSIRNGVLQPFLVYACATVVRFFNSSNGKNNEETTTVTVLLEPAKRGIRYCQVRIAFFFKL